MNIRGIDPGVYRKDLIQKVIVEKKANLPHLYGWPLYTWAKNFIESRNRINLLCAANQVSKSSTAIRKNIEWACNKKIWKELWPRNPEPRQFWYFYPTLEVATIEFEKKWVPEFMPRGNMKTHEWYGWNAEYSGGELVAIHFNSGVTIYFKTYSQRLINLQTATVHMVSCDEEMPPDYVDELLARLSATGGYFNAVFTATQGFPLWFRAMECIGKPEEVFKQAFKQCISLYDCQVYDDGSPGPWTIERIKEREQSCTTKNEILRRVYGRFVRDEGRKYDAFSPDKNLVQPAPVPNDWKYYAAVDIGSGGGKHRSSGSIVFLAVNPDYTSGRIVQTWRGDHQETTAADILDQYRMMRGKIQIMQACYDYQSREFGLLASRSGEPFIPADKARGAGEQTVNTLFKSGALVIEDHMDAGKLVTELMSLPAGDKNRSFQDDLADALRYVLLLVPWDYSKITPIDPSLLEALSPERDEAPRVGMTKEEYRKWEIEQRRGGFKEIVPEGWQELYDELAEWQEMYGS